MAGEAMWPALHLSSHCVKHTHSPHHLLSGLTFSLPKERAWLITSFLISFRRTAACPRRWRSMKAKSRRQSAPRGKLDAARAWLCLTETTMRSGEMKSASLGVSHHLTHLFRIAGVWLNFLATKWSRIKALLASLSSHASPTAPQSRSGRFLSPFSKLKSRSSVTT